MSENTNEVEQVLPPHKGGPIDMQLTANQLMIYVDCMKHTLKDVVVQQHRKVGMAIMKEIDLIESKLEALQAEINKNSQVE